MIVGLAGLGVVCGCISLPAELPASFFQPKRALAIVVTQCPESPELLSDAGDTGKPSLQGVAYLARQQAMGNRLKSLKADRIRTDLQAELTAVFQPFFTITTATNQLTLEVAVRRWGWSVPVDKHGLRTEGYDFAFRGTSRIRDMQTNGASVAFFCNGSETPIDIPVVEESCLRAYPQAVKAFAANVGKYLLKNRPGAAPEAAAVAR